MSASAILAHPSYGRLYLLILKFFIIPTDNEIDGLGFLELTIDDLNKLLPDKLGIVKRIYRLIQAAS